MKYLIVSLGLATMSLWRSQALASSGLPATKPLASHQRHSGARRYRR